MGKMLITCWEKINKDNDIRVVILTGAGDQAFCAGMDLKEVARLKKEGHQDILKGKEQNISCPAPSEL
jgi:enoyl-CoA hydratase/carnithine racemase